MRRPAPRNRSRSRPFRTDRPAGAGRPRRRTMREDWGEEDAGAGLRHSGGRGAARGRRRAPLGRGGTGAAGRCGRPASAATPAPRAASSLSRPARESPSARPGRAGPRCDVPVAGRSVSASGDGLREAVERACGCRARARGTVEVRVRLHRYALWDGVVHAFELDGHPAASLCYAWVSPAGRGEDAARPRGPGRDPGRVGGRRRARRDRPRTWRTGRQGSAGVRPPDPGRTDATRSSDARHRGRAPTPAPP